MRVKSLEVILNHNKSQNQMKMRRKKIKNLLQRKKKLKLLLRKKMIKKLKSKKMSKKFLPKLNLKKRKVNLKANRKKNQILAPILNLTLNLIMSQIEENEFISYSNI